MEWGEFPFRRLFWTVFLAVLFAGVVQAGAAAVLAGLSDPDHDDVMTFADDCPEEKGVAVLDGCPRTTFDPRIP